MIDKLASRCTSRPRLFESLGGIILIFLFIPIFFGGIDQTTTDALKVQHILKIIESNRVDSGKTTMQAATITQKELNAYFAYRLSREKNPLIQKLEVVLDNSNQVRGNVRFDLERVQILKLFGSDLRVDFDGRLQTREGAGKLDLTSLALNGESVPPKSLDPILFAIARFYGHEPGSINDWYELPHGIRRIELRKSEAVLFY